MRHNPIRSSYGQRQNRGLNENLARECLELHTVSPAAGYTQTDVTNFARLLTGWSVEARGDPPGFRFRPRAHEPGEQVVMGRTFADGEEGGVAALHFLANHPSTHRFLATKLARYFIADAPPVDATRHVEGVLRDTGGNLGSAADALITLESAKEYDALSITPYLRGLVYFSEHQTQLANVEFQGMLHRRGPATLINAETVAMAQLNTARGYAAAGDQSNAAQTYAQMLTLWPHADQDNPLLGEARAAVSR